MFVFGISVVKDYQTAFDWFNKAAIQGDALGEYKTGQMYHYGLELLRIMNKL